MDTTIDSHKTATTTTQEAVPGIRHMADARYHSAPWQLTLYHNGGKSRTFHATFENAVTAKRKAERLKAKEGSRALGYDRKAQLEYEEAKKLVGKDTPLIPILRDVAARYATGTERKSAKDAVEFYIKVKEEQGVAHKSLKDIRSRLRAFAAGFPDRPLESITRNEIVDWLTGLGVKGRTVWNYYAMLVAFYAYAERRDWVEKNPTRKIDPDADLPKIRKGPVHILTPEQAEKTMRYIEVHEPRFIGWACVQYFAGIRDAEAERIRGEWIDRKLRRIVLPGWHLEGEQDEAEGITKTRDEWVMDDLPDAFWGWVTHYPKAFAKGLLTSPSNRAWCKIRDALIAQGVFPRWPANGFRHSFATYHLSAYRDQSRTSLLLRHQDADRLWNSYLAKLVPKETGLAYLSLAPRPVLKPVKS